MPFTPPAVAAGQTVKAADINTLGTQYDQAIADLTPSIAAKVTAVSQRVAITSATTAVAGMKYAADVSGGAFTVTLPATNKVSDQIVIQKTDTSATLVSFTGKIDGVASTTGSLRTQNQGKVFQGDGSGNWNIVAGDISVSALDLRYAAIGSGGGGGDSLANLDKIETLTSTGTFTLADSSVAGIHVVNLTVATSAATFPSTPAPTSTLAKGFSLYLVQDATGGRVVTWPTNVKWAGGIVPSFRGTANSIDELVFRCIDGTNWLGSVGGQAF